MKKIIRDHYRDLADLRMRDSYYVVRDYLGGDLGEVHIGVEMTQDDYDWFLTNQGYSSYRDDIWTWMEQKENFVRPRAIPEGVLWDHGTMYTMAEWEEGGLDFIWTRARGFIFVEKRGPAGDISEISNYGWTIVTVGKGFPTRLVRELLKEDDRPVLALHDCDISGEGIFRALGFTTRRTAHLDIALGDRVTDLGMSQEDVDALNLPSQPEAPKFRMERETRTELNALTVLKLRMGVVNPFLEYVIAKMHEAGLTISEMEISKKELWRSSVKVGINMSLSSIVRDIMKEEIGNYDLKGDAVRLEHDDIEVAKVNLKPLVVSAMQKASKNLTWIYKEDRHEEALEGVSLDLLTALGIEREDD